MYDKYPFFKIISFQEDLTTFKKLPNLKKEIFRATTVIKRLGNLKNITSLTKKSP